MRSRSNGCKQCLFVQKRLFWQIKGCYCANMVIFRAEETDPNGIAQMATVRNQWTAIYAE
jgi:hypothetical protein